MKKTLFVGLALALGLSACNPIDFLLGGPDPYIEPVTHPNPKWGGIAYVQAQDYLKCKNVDKDSTAIELCKINEAIYAVPGGPNTQIRAWYGPTGIDDAASHVINDVTIVKDVPEKVNIITTMSHWSVVGYYDVSGGAFPGGGYVPFVAADYSEKTNSVTKVTTVTVKKDGFELSWDKKMITLGGIDLLVTTRFSGELTINNESVLDGNQYIFVVEAKGGKGGWIDFSSISWMSWWPYAPDNYTAFWAKFADKVLTVSLGAYNFPDKPTAPATTLKSSDITITSNLSWTITKSDNSSWLTLSKTSGYRNSTFTMTAASNTGAAARTATVTIKGGDITRTITVTQDAP